MNETSRAQGWAICGGAGVAALLFLIGILNGSYWALAIPVAIVTFFALGLVAWVGYTIATIQVETDVAPEILATERSDAPAAVADPSPSAAASTSATPRSGDADAAPGTRTAEDAA